MEAVWGRKGQGDEGGGKGYKSDVGWHLGEPPEGRCPQEPPHTLSCHLTASFLRLHVENSSILQLVAQVRNLGVMCEIPPSPSPLSFVTHLGTLAEKLEVGWGEKALVFF